MYDYLKSIGLFPVMHRRGKKKKHRIYHIEFTTDYHKNQIIEYIYTDWGYIRGAESIHLCQNEIVIESFHTKININYKDIDKFEVYLAERGW